MSMYMITNWKKIDASDDKDVDPTLYRQLIRSLMYFGQHWVRYLLRSQYLNSVHGRAKEGTLGSSEAYSEVCT